MRDAASNLCKLNAQGAMNSRGPNRPSILGGGGLEDFGSNEALLALLPYFKYGIAKGPSGNTATEAMPPYFFISRATRSLIL